MTRGETASPAQLTAQVRGIGRAGDPAGALALLRTRLREQVFGPEDLPAVGRLAERLLASPLAGAACQRVLVLGQCTTSWLTKTLMAVALQRDIACVATEGPFDNVLQAIDALDPASAPDILVLLPWHQRLLGASDCHPDELVAGELAFWQQAWRLAAARGVKRLLQAGYDWTGPGPQGYHLAGGSGGQLDLVRQVNHQLRAALPTFGGAAYFVALDDISGTLGRRSFYDARSQYWTRQPFSEAGLALLSAHLVAGMRALLTGPRKLLILDLDNTLWGGVVGETGSDGIELGENAQGEAFRSFQHHLRALSRRGVLLAVCSKNNDADARAPFLSNPGMVLQLGDFAHFVASWETKTAGIERIARELRLGLDSVVFFDDSAFERDMVRQTLPAVEVVDVPDDPAGYIEALEAGLWFESCTVTDEDRRRARLYAVDAQRRQDQSAAASVTDYLASLAMGGELLAIDEASLARVVQLLSKTNQFNLTTRRHTADEVRRLLALPGSIGLALRLRDRYADHGLVAVAIGVPDPAAGAATLRIDTFLMSCRVIGRSAEVFLLQGLLQRAAALGYARVAGEYIPSTKNELVSGFYGGMGFAPQQATDGSTWSVLELPYADQHACYVAALS